MSDKVVQAFPGVVDIDNPLQLEKKPPGGPTFCYHHAVRINVHDRTIHCADCGKAHDPFDFVATQAVTIERAWQSHAQAKKMTEELNERVTFLKKEEDRLRAMVKRLKAKTDDVVMVRGKAL